MVADDPGGAARARGARALGLESFPKTSGGKGFHVLVPLDRRSTYDDARAFAELVASRSCGRTRPGHPEWSKARRRGVLIDANQNGEGKTIASVYSVRPRPGAPVSTPLAGTRSTGSIPARSRWARCSTAWRDGDLYAGMLTTRQSLSKALKRLASPTGSVCAASFATVSSFPSITA